jgi:DNA (cytosine-5)-methyltransferase 1
MKHASLFSGIGGFDLAAQWMGWENVFHCEINPFGQQVLKHYWPNSILYDDITKTDFTIHRGNIDILTGGFPCQPYSAAGKRLGTEDDRHLWPSMLRAIREIQPTWVVGENVRGLTNWNGGLVFDEMQADLEAAGYSVQSFLLPAAGVGAPHERYRIWFVAYNSNARIESMQSGRKNGIYEYRIASNAASNRLERIRDFRIYREKEKCEFKRFSPEQPSSDTESQQSKRLQFEQCKYSKPKQSKFRGSGIKMGCKLLTPNTDSRRQSSKEHRETKSRRIAETSLSGNWSNFPTQSPVCSRNDGLSSQLVGITFPKHRNESIKSYGNSVVPQVVYQIFKAIEQCTQ